MGRFVSATGQFLLATYGQSSCPPTGSSRCPLTAGAGPAAGTAPVAKRLTPGHVDPAPGFGLAAMAVRVRIRSRHGNGGCERGMSLTPQEVRKVVNRYIGVAGATSVTSLTLMGPTA